MNNKVAIMQPYIFPYLGYFQLIESVDHFVIYDDVNFIKQGWINRNNILQNGEALTFTIPLHKASSFSKINEVEINLALYKKWERKFWKTISQSYSKAPFYNDTRMLLEEVLTTPNSSISELASNSILKVLEFLNISKAFSYSSESFNNSQGLDKADRIISITKSLNSNYYINRLGGKSLYDKDYFKMKGIELKFVESKLPLYNQFSHPFVKGLSIIDVLMFNAKDDIKFMFQQFELV
tara:strand:- start:2342 stop:3055 length:714 start_codon:yes stop_codon:yes gene_type:complete